MFPPKQAKKDPKCKFGMPRQKGTAEYERAIGETHPEASKSFVGFHAQMKTSDS